MGPGVTGLVKDLVGKPPTLDDGRPGGFYIPRFRNLKDRQPGFVRGYGYEGNSGHTMFPAHVMDTAGVGRAVQRGVPGPAPAPITLGAFCVVLAPDCNYAVPAP